jgi:hypothetical protein
MSNCLRDNVIIHVKIICYERYGNRKRKGSFNERVWKFKKHVSCIYMSCGGTLKRWILRALAADF